MVDPMRNLAQPDKVSIAHENVFIKNLVREDIHAYF